MIQDAQNMFENLSDANKASTLQNEIQNLYILLKEKSRDDD